MYPQNVEKWRGIVTQAITALLADKPSKKNALNATGATISTLPDIVLALIQKESSGDALAKGDSGNSRGLMQLNYKAGTPQGEGYKGTIDGLSDAFTNIYYGTSYFLTQLAKYGSVPKAILAYNAGSVRVSNTTGQPINMQYLNDVLSYIQKKNSLLADFLQSELSALQSGNTWTKKRDAKS